MPNVFALLSQQGYFTRADLSEPVTLTISGLEWDDFSAEWILRFSDHQRRLALRDKDFQELCAITGTSSINEWRGRSVRLYPVDHPHFGIELF